MKNVLEIDVARYRLHVLIFWDIDFRAIAKYVKKRGCKVTEEWIQHSTDWSTNASGTCQNIGEGNTKCNQYFWGKPTRKKS
jgi:hypothetical protein